MKATTYIESEIEAGWPAVVITKDDLIKHYGDEKSISHGQRMQFCWDCSDYQNCKGIKWPNCSNRKYYIEEEIKSKKKQPKPRYHRWTKKEDKTIIRMKAKNRNHKHIAKAIGRTYMDVTTRIDTLRKKGIAVAYMPKIDWEKYDNDILTLWCQGFSYNEIAYKTGISKCRVNYRISHMRKKGVIKNDQRR